jgi:twinkle protein
MEKAIESLVLSEVQGTLGTRSFHCPECSDERSPQGSRKKPLRVTYEEDAAVWFCHHCESKGQVTLKKDTGIRTVPNHNEVNSSVLKKISLERGFNLNSLPENVRGQMRWSDDVYYSSISAKADSIGFLYPDDDAIKWRSLEGKNFTATGAARSLFPAGQTIGRNEVVFLTEGEYDALALISAGFVAFSSPSGANIPSGPEPPDYLKPLISDLKSGHISVVVAVDSDERGEKFRDSLLEYLGRENVGYIDWSEFDCKDANECIQKHGVDGVKKAANHIKEVLFEGIVTARNVASSIDEIRSGGFRQGTGIGIPSLDKLMTICSDQISVVTGVPGSGKSELIDAFMVRLAMQEDWKFAIFSAENPIDIHVGKLAEKYIGRPIFEGDERMSSDELKNASDWLDNHFYFLDPASSNTLRSILDRAAVLVEHKKINGLLIDPFNYTDVTLDTDSISNMLTELHAFATKHHIHIWIVAHPQKLYRQEGGRMPTPMGMDISGSAAWFAKADFGLTVERTEDNETRVVVWKCRFKWLGDTGTAYLKYDPVSGRFSEGSSADEIAAGIDLDEGDKKKDKTPGEIENERRQEDFTFDIDL